MYSECKALNYREGKGMNVRSYRLRLVPKEKMINVRLSPQMHDDFKIACELRGASMSSLLHQYIARTVREEKEMAPRAFAQPPMKGIKSGGTIHLTPQKKRKTS